MGSRLGLLRIMRTCWLLLHFLMGLCLNNCCGMSGSVVVLAGTLFLWRKIVWGGGWCGSATHELNLLF